MLLPDGLDSEHAGSLEEQHEEQGQLEGRLAQDVPPHGSGYETGSALVGFPEERSLGRRLGAESQCTHGVHD